MADLKEEERAELLVLYQASVSDIAYFKSQQVAVANYAVLLYAGVYAAHQVLKNSLLAIIVTVLILVFFFLILCELKSAISVRRARLSSIRGKLSDTFRDSWAAGKKSELEWIVSVFFTVVVVGAIIDLLLICGVT